MTGAPSRHAAYGPLARDTAWVATSQGMRVILQLTYFLLAARALGAAALGSFAASLALVSILGTFAALGTGNLLVMHVSRRPDEFREHWGNALVAIPAVGFLLAIVAVAVAALVPALDVRIVSVLCASELLFNRAADTAGQAFQALGRFWGAAATWTVVPAFRAVAAIALVTVFPHDLLRWAVLYTTATAIGGVLAVGVVSVLVATPAPKRRWGLADPKLGVYFSLSQAASSMYADIDKTMLAQIASTHAAGIYTVAYRAVNAAFVPTISLFQAAYGRFFKRGDDGIAATRALARTLIPYTLGVNVMVALVMFFGAPLAPVLLGSGYADVVGALRWLALVPLLQSFSYAWGDVLTGAGDQGLRTSVQVGGAALNVLLNALLDPSYGWRGAAWATLLTFAALSLALRVAVGVAGQPSDETATQVVSA